MRALRLHLADESATLALGTALARTMGVLRIFPALLLEGGLGAGKTTFTRGLVESLPGGHMAEVASPSFNYMNVYPTTPQTSHFDLYRLKNHGVDEDIMELMHGENSLVIVEWAEHCPKRQRPRPHLHFLFSRATCGRDLAITASGDKTTQVLVSLRQTTGTSPAAD